jgi:hypothetical protein
MYRQRNFRIWSTILCLPACMMTRELWDVWNWQKGLWKRRHNISSKGIKNKKGYRSKKKPEGLKKIWYFFYTYAIIVK